MTEKTIIELPAVTSIDENALLIVDTGTETFKITSADLAIFFRDSVLPAGLTSPYAGSTAPDGWLLADGSAVSRSTYARLFAAIGTAYGIGNGSTTFNVPDLRGRVVVGKDDMGGAAALRLTTAVAGFDGATLGAAGGSQATTPAGTIGGSQSIAHTHSVTSNVSVATQPSFTVNSHTHGFAHVHEWVYTESGGGGHSYSQTAPTDSKTTFSVSDFNFGIYTGAAAGGGQGVFAGLSVSNTHYYTTGAVSAPSGTGSSVATDTASSTATTRTVNTALTNTAVTSGGMSTNATVNGSNFTFTGTAGHRVQPSLVQNYIVKT